MSERASKVIALIIIVLVVIGIAYMLRLSMISSKNETENTKGNEINSSESIIKHEDNIQEDYAYEQEEEVTNIDEENYDNEVENESIDTEEIDIGSSMVIEVDRTVSNNSPYEDFILKQLDTLKGVRWYKNIEVEDSNSVVDSNVQFDNRNILNNLTFTSDDIELNEKESKLVVQQVDIFKGDGEIKTVVLPKSASENIWDSYFRYVCYEEDNNYKNKFRYFLVKFEYEEEVIYDLYICEANNIRLIEYSEKENKFEYKFTTDYSSLQEGTYMFEAVTEYLDNEDKLLNIDDFISEIKSKYNME